MSVNMPTIPPTSRMTTAAPQLTPCVYLAMRCPICGELRLALANLPSTSDVACPLCGKLCSFALLGSGLTKAQLPFYEIPPVERIRWTIRSAGLADCT